MITASFNKQEEKVWASHNQYKPSPLAHTKTSKKKFDLVTDGFTNQWELVWASYYQFEPSPLQQQLRDISSCTHKN